jgi:hypothetical protein
VFLPVAKNGHARIVHRLDLDHIERRDATPMAIPGTIGICGAACFMIACGGGRH